MPHDASCLALALEAEYVLGEPGEVAFEDYARALLRADAADALHGTGATGGAVTGVHLCRPKVDVSPALQQDLEAFARSLVEASAGSGLGWS